MNRQMRTQMPQTQKRGKNTGKKKQFDRNACLLVTVQIFAGILILLLLTASDNKKLNNTLDETFDFAKTRIERYEIYNTNDQVKSLVRLMDKTTELSRVLAQEGNLSAEMLLDIMYEIPKDDSIGQVIITKEYIEGNGGPQILLRGQEVPLLPHND